jgi:hypothetical protein
MTAEPFTLPRFTRVSAAAFVAFVALTVAACSSTPDNAGRRTPSRQDEVAAKGRTVMPFDLNRTTHRFTKTPEGGVQTVVADDPLDQTQIRLIRGHLAQEATRFARGDFADPTSIHGSAMPGVAELSRSHARIQIQYGETPPGAKITYTTSDKALVSALHTWFDAQVSDHGQHAEPG